MVVVWWSGLVNRWKPIRDGAWGRGRGRVSIAGASSVWN